ncbi:MAG TPA: TonB-dependent receptor plug domain-containing protein [Cyclobacteriaceae bacterium]
MKRFCFVPLLVVGLTVYAQSDPPYMDSVPLLLETVLVQTFKIENDRLQSFYKTSQSATTENILCHLQSVYLIRRGAYGQEPMMRGLSAGQLSVTIDGMKMFGACTDKMDPVTIYIEPQNLKNINVATGPSGSGFGSTVGGSIDMQLAEPSFTKALFGEAGVTYQSVSNGVTAYTVVNKSLSKSAFRFSSV